MRSTESIDRHRESHKLNQVCCAQKAIELWAGFTDDEKTLVRFGMFPAEKMQRATAELVAAEVPSEDAGRLLSVALMECAAGDGGMRA